MSVLKSKAISIKPSERFAIIAQLSKVRDELRALDMQILYCITDALRKTVLYLNEVYVFGIHQAYNLVGALLRQCREFYKTFPVAQTNKKTAMCA